MRRWISFCAYPVFFLLFVAVTVEIGSRLLLDEVDTPETVRKMALARLLNSAAIGGVDAPLGMRLSPNVERTVHWGELTYTVRTNSLGFRGREPAPRAAAEHRILFLGDSMVFGHGLGEEDTLPHRVELRLRTSVPGGVVYNGAISGMNTVQELAAVLQLLPILAPDRVILGYFIGNDPLANTFSEVGDDGRVIFSDDDVGRLQTDLDRRTPEAAVAERRLPLRRSALLRSPVALPVVGTGRCPGSVMRTALPDPGRVYAGGGSILRRHHLSPRRGDRWAHIPLVGQPKRGTEPGK